MMMQTMKLNIDGMTCQGCVRSVKQALQSLKGVDNVAVDLAQGTAVIDYQENTVNQQQCIEAIENAGFDVIPD